VCPCACRRLLRGPKPDDVAEGPREAEGRKGAGKEGGEGMEVDAQLGKGEGTEGGAEASVKLEAEGGADIKQEGQEVGAEKGGVQQGDSKAGEEEKGGDAGKAAAQPQQGHHPGSKQPQAEGKKAGDGEATRQLEMVRRKVDEVWQRRIAEGDPLEAKCMRKRVEEAVDAWVESQIVCHADNK